MKSLYRSINARFIVAHKIILLILLTTIGIQTINGQRSCYQCDGINCLRTSNTKVERCSNSVDICATIFNGQTIQAQGCLENLAEDLREKCDSDDLENMTECHKCNGNLCNNMGASLFKCIQCDSKIDSKCSDYAHLIEPERCPISRTNNQFCYAKKDGDWVVRGCTSTLEQQISCLDSQECIICQPSEINSCNIHRATEDEEPSSPTPTSPTSSTPTTSQPNGSGTVLINSFVLTSCVVLLMVLFIK